jgi:hypothetical protein
MDTKCLARLTDAQLVDELHSLAARERAATAGLIAAIGEVDTRRLYLDLGYSSLFVFCTERLHLSEHAAYGRITAARAARTFPSVMTLLEDGSLNLTAVTLLAPHLTAENHAGVLHAATHKSRREVERLAAALRPQPPVANQVRRLPTVSRTDAAGAGNSQQDLAADASNRQHVTGAEQGLAIERKMSVPGVVPESVPAPPMPPVRPAVVAPLSPERYKVQLTITRETHDKLRRVQDLMRHTVPNGDPAVIFDLALGALLDRLEKRKLARTPKPKPPRPAVRQYSRHVPSAVKREVWARDEGRCTYVGTHGRCSARAFLELHHIVPYADGGATDATNLTLRCRAHNQHEAEGRFGPWILREGRMTYELGSNRVESSARMFVDSGVRYRAP